MTAIEKSVLALLEMNERNLKAGIIKKDEYELVKADAERRSSLAAIRGMFREDKYEGTTPREKEARKLIHAIFAN